MRAHQNRNLRQKYSFSDDVWETIEGLGLASPRRERELQRLQKLSEKRQMEVLQVLSSHPKLKVLLTRCAASPAVQGGEG